MKFIILIYTDREVLREQAPAELDAALRECFAHTDSLTRNGQLLESNMLGDSKDSRSIRVHRGQSFVSDGPFIESKEILGGYNIIEADDLDGALEIAKGFPWARFGTVEVRPLQDLSAVRKRVASAGEKEDVSQLTQSRGRGPTGATAFY